MTNYQLIFILSIDSFYMEVISDLIRFPSKKREVLSLLEETNNLLEKEDFDIDVDFELIISNKPDDIKHSTYYTLNDLGYDAEDVVEVLKTLSIDEYSETRLDEDDPHPPLLFIFGKIINGKLVYIKIKNKGMKEKHVICVSFHYAKGDMLFPYA